MKPATALARIFTKALNAKQKANLRWHLKKGTPIACGRMADQWYTDDGYL